MCTAPPSEARVTARTAYVFFKCGKCGHIWEMEMPKDYRFKWARK